VVFVSKLFSVEHINAERKAFMGTSITIDQLERMKTHELADLLSNVVLLLRRMPNVECREFTRDLAPPEQSDLLERQREQRNNFLDDRSSQPSTNDTIAEQPPSQITWTLADLEGKKLDELKQIAKDLHLRVPSNIRKNDLLNKLQVRLSRSHSEQYAIQDI
jgi:hypothetical protein